MNELTLLREFQSGVPGPSAAETAAARDLLAAAISTEAAQVAQPGVGRAGGPVRRGRAGRRGRRFWLPAAGVTCAAAVAIAAVAVIEPGHRPLRPGPAPSVQTAAFVLHQAASAAAAQAAGHGRYFVSESEYIDPGNGQDAPAKRTIWIGNGVSGRLVQGHAPAAAITPGISFGRRTISWAQLRDLPSRPGQLLAEITRVSANLGQPLPVAEFSTITGLLFESPTPPALRAALFLAAARLPGVTVVRDAHDLLGRSADEVYIRPGFAGNDGQALFFDPFDERGTRPGQHRRHPAELPALVRVCRAGLRLHRKQVPAAGRRGVPAAPGDPARHYGRLPEGHGRPGGGFTHLRPWQQYAVTVSEQLSTSAA